MFYLCSIRSLDLVKIFGGPAIGPDSVTPPKYPNVEVILLGQKPDCSGYLIFTNTVVDEMVQQYSVPEGYDFIFRQEWGLRITEETLHKVIDTLRKEAYPPIADYLDAKVKGDLVQEQAYIDACLAVKAKYPKFEWA